MRTRTAMSATAAALLAAAAGITLIPDASAAPAIGHNGRIAYSKTVSSNTDVYTIKADGTGQVRLTTAAGADTMPTYSASGQQLVYVRQPTSTALRELWTMHADGTAKRKVTTVNTAQSCPPQFSPDGKRIAFAQTVSGNRRIWTVAADGTAKRQAFTPPASLYNGIYVNAQDDCARWSPKPGAGLAYVRTWSAPTSDDPAPEIRLNTGAADRGTGCAAAWKLVAFDFSPDGSNVIMIGTYSEERFQVCAVGVGATRSLGSPDDGYGPAWSPDGRFIAVGTSDGVHLVRVDSGAQVWLRAESQLIRSLSWQPVR